MVVRKPNMVGVLGAGKFGCTVAGLLSTQVPVLLYHRSPLSSETIEGMSRWPNVSTTGDPEEICGKCRLMFPIVPSADFRSLIRSFSGYLMPFHMLIHGTKGVDVDKAKLDDPYKKIYASQVETMSQVIRMESRVVRVGCLSGPNLSVEIRRGLPAATVLASEFDEVIALGHKVLGGNTFKIYGSHDLLGTELAGSLKNIIAIGTGMVAGLDLGKNAEALLITRGLREMLLVGQTLGADPKTFFGTAGLGDLVATATSPDSRNYQFGMQLGQGMTKEDIMARTDDLVEGVRMVEIAYRLAQTYRLSTPIIEVLYGIIFRQLPLPIAVSYLFEYPYSLDVDYIHLKK